jgi:serine/threonine protein kinase
VGVATFRVPSGELLEVVAKENNLTEAIAVGYLCQLLQAVETLHKLKVAHLDIRVSHVTVT